MFVSDVEAEFVLANFLVLHFCCGCPGWSVLSLSDVALFVVSQKGIVSI